MGSQFVDFDADGVADVLTATYEGSVYVARGLASDEDSKKPVGFADPVHVLDRDGQRIGL